MLPYCSSGSHDSRVESIVRYCFFADFAADPGNGRGVKSILSGGLINRLGVGVTGTRRGNLLGLCGENGTISCCLGSKDKAWNADETDTFRSIPLPEEEGYLLSTGYMIRASSWEGLNIKGAGFFGTLRGGGAIRLDLGSSLGVSQVPRAVAGLGAAWPVFRFLAMEVLGRARVEIDCAEGGRIPEPTLALKEEFDVVLETPDLVR